VSVLVVVAAFFVGAIPFGVVVSRLFYRRDIREAGSGNIGAANALRALGLRGAVAVLVLDALKGAAAVLAGRAVGGETLAAVAALAAVAGHCFSPFLGGRGGKGVATSFGAIVALAWTAGIAFAAVWLAALLATRYASVASMLASAAMVPALWYAAGPAAGGYGLASALFIIIMHRGNLARLRAGTENELPLFKGRSARSANSGRS
jgi:glycerol-3-phosphate acyltransferase PlsY